MKVGKVFLKVTLGFFIMLKIGIGLNSSEVSGFSASWQRTRPAVRRRAQREIMMMMEFVVVVVVVVSVDNVWRFC